METFTLTDRKGQTVTYQVMAHPVDEGLPILMQLGGLSLPAIIQAVSALLGSEAFIRAVSSLFKKEEGPAGDSAAELLEVFGSIDFGGVSDEVRKSLMSPALAPLVRKLMKYTTREVGGHHFDLGDPGSFELSYAGNYMELLQAATKVAMAGGFFPDGSGLFGRLRKRMAEATSPSIAPNGSSATMPEA